MEYKLVIPERLPNLNDYTAANRMNPYVGARMKKNAQRLCEAAVRLHLGHIRIDKPVIIHYTFYELDRRRDHDNVSAFAHKVIQDALVTCKVLKDDGWKEVLGDTNKFYVDRNNPRIEVIIEEIEA